MSRWSALAARRPGRDRGTVGEHDTRFGVHAAGHGQQRIAFRCDDLPQRQRRLAPSATRCTDSTTRPPPGVTEAAGKLQKLGAIKYSRGNITVLNRRLLENSCCECYAVVKHETDRLLPVSPPTQ